MPNEWFKRNFSQRKFITNRNENKISYLQFIGLLLIGGGIVYMTLFRLLYHISSAEGMAISFFMITLGVSFVFPSLLQDQNKGLSTMRITVFMMTNIICMLLLKIGWSDKINSLKDIGLDQWWMGVIAFIFGAKATQSYFENKMWEKQNNVSNNATPNIQVPDNALNSPQLINAAIQQNQNLKTKYPNIENMLLGSMNLNGHNVFCVDIHLNDSNSNDIPSQLAVILNGNPYTVPVNLITDIGPAKTNASKGDTVINQTNGSAPGTLGCFLSDRNKQNFYALSCCHVFTNDQWITYSGNDVPKNQISDTTTGQQIGNWIFGIMNSSFDIGYAKINNGISVPRSTLSQPRDVNDMDILHKTPVSFNGATTPLGSGFINNYGCTRTVRYGGNRVDINNLILISNNGVSPSHAGDSGALVYTTHDNEPIGLVIGADTVFSYVIPITSILTITGKIIY